MSTMNIQRLQLPDGRLVRIEGGDAAETARLVANYLGGSSGVVTNVPASGPVEQPLPVPVWNFSKEERSQPPSASVANAGEEPALPPPPSLKFS